MDRTVLILAALFVVGLVAVGVQQVLLEGKLVEATAIEEARRYSDALQEFRTLYTQEVVQAVRTQNIVVTHDFKNPKYQGKAIPLPATLSMRLGEMLTAKRSGGETKLYSKYPFPYPGRKNLSERDQFARDAWAALNDDSKNPFFRFENLNGKRMLRYATADLMRKSCLDCHNTHDDSQKKDWQEGQVRGVLEVTLPLDAAIAQTAENRTRSYLLLICIGGVGLFGLVVVIGRLRKSSYELEKRVADRTCQLAETNQQLERANRIKSEFVANMSHEVRTPMNAVIGLTELLLESNLTPTQREHMSIVLSSAESLMTIIDDILDFSKMEAGKLDFAEVRFNLHETVGDATKSLALRAEQAGLELISIIDPLLPVELIGDPGRLRQVLTNLVTNAVKFTRRGEIVVRVEPDRAALSADDAVLHFSVRDTGIGIPQEELETIFQPFEQIDNSLRRSHAGTGLGLAICSRLVAGIHGRIWVESQVGKGSTFHFTARFRLPENVQTELAPAPHADPIRLHRLRILLAEDSRANQLVAEALLRHHGHETVVANNGSEALKNLESADFDLVLMDVQMPEMDGLQTTAAIRRQEKSTGRHLPIVAMTAQAMLGDRENCLAAGMDDYVTKPLRAQKLFAAIARAIPDAVLPNSDDSPPAEEIIDWSGPLQAVGGKRELLMEIVPVYVQEIREFTGMLGEAIDEKNAKEVQRLAHTIKSAARFFSAGKPADLALELEKMGRNNAINSCQVPFESLKDQLNRLVASLEEFLQRP